MIPLRPDKWNQKSSSKFDRKNVCFYFYFKCCFVWHVHRRIDRIRPPRFFIRRVEASKKIDEDKFSESNQFQDQNIRLSCFGDCGSEINKFLIDNTNMKIYQTCEKPERYFDIRYARGLPNYYKKFSFLENSKENEERLVAILVAKIEAQAKLLSMEVTKHVPP